ncbi:MAG: ketoacyl-ACP synthase III [Planctomycetes bacterium]|nr:ketoacyl-ACP synthase III [Planctomycetota bacterium]
MRMNAAITGWGWHSPDRILNNKDLEKLVDTDDAWIRSRTGIRERRIAGPGDTTGSMCLHAARTALDRANLPANDLDLVICATTTPDHLLPATACLLQQRLGARHAGAFDLNAACSGFIYGVTVASQFIQTGTYRRILIVSGETLSRFTNYHDRNTCVLFGDGAAAVILEATPQKAGVLSTVLGSRGDVEGYLSIEAGGSAQPATADTVATGAHLVRMRGNEIFKMAVRCMAVAAHEALDQAGLTLDDIDHVIPHQANSRIITATQQAIGVPPSKVYVNVEKHGNTGASSVPIALGEMLENQPIRVGDNLLMVAFGGGMTWAAAVLRWADVAAIRRERSLKLSA